MTYEEHLAYNSITALAYAIRKLRDDGIEPEAQSLANALFNTSFNSTVGPISFEQVSVTQRHFITMD